MAKSILVPVSHKYIRCKMMYDLLNISGAVKHPFLADIACARLHIAADNLRKKFGSKYKLLIWDAFRSRETQQAIYDAYRLDVSRKCPQLVGEALDAKTREFVNPPTGMFPHGCGGAVDVTFLIDEREAEMGTEFDSFTPHAATNYFETHKPHSEKEIRAKRNRRILAEVMQYAGFVPLSFEWWHFEFGTNYWSSITGNPSLLNSIFPAAPSFEDSATARPIFPKAQPFQQDGIAPEFCTPERRSASLMHNIPDHHYARTSHPTVANAEQQLMNLLQAKSCWCIESGLAASWTTFTGIVPSGGRILADKHIYYETQTSMKIEARLRNWELVFEDFLNVSAVANRLKREKFDLAICDSPRNWLLDLLPIDILANLAVSNGAIFVVDTSIQPLQPALSGPRTGTIISLSKYPSSGLDSGGAIASNDAELLTKLRRETGHVGHVLSLNAAHLIQQQLLWLPSRMKWLSENTKAIAEFLKSHPAVRQVRLPDAVNGLVGGQLSFHLHNPLQGINLERIVGYNSIRNGKTLNLACTFGASFTTIEFFDGSPRCREMIPRHETNEVLIPHDLVRLGVGPEDAGDIIRELEFSLNCSGLGYDQLNLKPWHERVQSMDSRIGKRGRSRLTSPALRPSSEIEGAAE